MSELFPFVHLPALVQTRILRQYVPFSVKATVLSTMPEFAGLLDRDSPCWMHGYGAMHDLLPALSSLATGCYVRTGDGVPRNVYHVSMDRENRVTFTLCTLLNTDWGRYGRWERRRGPSAWQRSSVGSKDGLLQFIQLFLNTYAPARHTHLRAYVKGRHVFVLDRLHRKIFWDTGIAHDLFRSGNCAVRIGYGEPPYAYLHADLSDDTVAFAYDGQREVLRSVPFESVVEGAGGSVEESRKVFEIGFEILEDKTIRTSLDVRRGFCFSQDASFWTPEWVKFFRTHEAMQRLSEAGRRRYGSSYNG